ncbi:MAG: antibiotic biosynthesis monooxygenase [Deltaproteobacteria bacterium]|nr:antibiotic biosynthesis monooxygenase [Deltaproteobacteria bacterium]
MYIAMNQFTVVPGKGKEFEEMWKSRETFLGEVPGFKEFHLLKGENDAYISHSTWESREAFTRWTESEAFRKAHAQGGSKGLIQGPPRFSGYEVVL